MGPVRFVPVRVGGPTETLVGATLLVGGLALGYPWLVISVVALVALSAGVFDVTLQSPLAGQRYAGRPGRSHRRVASPLSPWRVEGRPS